MCACRSECGKGEIWKGLNTSVNIGKCKCLCIREHNLVSLQGEASRPMSKKGTSITFKVHQVWNAPRVVFFDIKDFLQQ